LGSFSSGIDRAVPCLGQTPHPPGICFIVDCNNDIIISLAGFFGSFIFNSWTLSGNINMVFVENPEE
jgi:hypothetical protein